VSTNHWPDTTRVEHGDFTFDLAGYKTIQSLHASECEKASQIMDWWSYAETTPVLGGKPLTLTPFEIAVIRG